VNISLNHDIGAERLDVLGCQIGRLEWRAIEKRHTLGPDDVGRDV
jgi:hypothetical protein